MMDKYFIKECRDIEPSLTLEQIEKIDQIMDEENHFNAVGQYIQCELSEAIDIFLKRGKYNET